MEFCETKQMYNDWIFQYYKKRILTQFFLGRQASENRWIPVWNKEIDMLHEVKSLYEVETLITKIPHGDIIEKDKNCNLLEWHKPIISYYPDRFFLHNNLSSVQSSYQITTGFDTMTNSRNDELMPVLLMYSNLSEIVIRSINDEKIILIDSGIKDWHIPFSDYGIGVHVEALRGGPDGTTVFAFPVKWNSLCQFKYDKKMEKDQKLANELKEKRMREEKEKNDLEQKMIKFMNDF